MTSRDGSGAHRRHIRASGLTLLALVLSVSTACTSGATKKKDDGAQRAATALAAGLVKGTLEVPVASGTTETAQKAMHAVTAGMGEATATVKVHDVSVKGKRAAVRLLWTWDLPGTETPWSYDAPAELVDTAGTWRVTWKPTVIEPSLTGSESLHVAALPAKRGDILGARNTPLVKDRSVLRFGIDKTLVRPAKARASAGALAELLGIDAPGYQKRVAAAGPKAFVEAVVLRETDATPAIRNGYPSIDGALAIAGQAPLAPSKEFARAILGSVGPVTAEMLKAKESPYAPGDEAGLSGLQQRYDTELRGSSGVGVLAVSSDGKERSLFNVQPQSGSALRTTLSLRLQTEAENALAAVVPASALVAVRPSDGAILAIASGPGSNGYNTASFGEYAPGSTFKVVTALGLLRSGLTPTSTVHCTPTLTVDGKPFKNYDDYPAGELGDIALRTAFANSCNTAFISQRNVLTDATQQGAGAALGFGVDHDLGFPAYFGSLPSAESQTEHAASMIGQGKVLASPMAMATVVASVVRGAAVVPRLLVGHDPGVQPPAQPLTAHQAQQLRSLMRSTVTEGSGALLAGLPGPPVIAKTGTAEFGSGDPLPTHVWMIAAQGDLAVAVFVDRGQSGSGTAGPILEAFLRAARS